MRAVLWTRRAYTSDRRPVGDLVVVSFSTDREAPTPVNHDSFMSWTSTGWKIAATHPMTTEPDCTCIMLERTGG